ncbi:MAG TPA: S41 family peptidase, partial [Bacillota bacterium]|nr:S41 family peptidase [Bacillota bacterium]
ASASEIVAGALQDREAALLVGTVTFGKATVQHLTQLSGDNALRLTVAKYLTPSGRDIHGQGLQPDYPVEMPAALKYYQYFLPGRLNQGSYGMDVELLQGMLQELGYEVKPSGYFDESTAAALVSFQKDCGLNPTGIFDDITWVEMREALDAIAMDHDPQLQKAIELTGQAELWEQARR